jgi:hypothetical protein
MRGVNRFRSGWAVVDEDGHCTNNKPTPKVSSQAKTWASGNWHGEHAWLTNDTPPKVVSDPESAFLRTLRTAPLLPNED